MDFAEEQSDGNVLLTPQEWSAWMYKHLYHHLRQFGA